MSTVWITGASSGLGYYTAEALRNNGYTVIAGARSFKGNEKDCCFELDVTDPESIRAFTEKAIRAGGEPDILINCAGILVLGPCESYTDDEIRRVMETNFFGQVKMIQAVLPYMRERKKGRIINFSSLNGVFGIPFQGAYTASKHAVEGFSECLAIELLPYNIEVMLVEPGDHSGGSQKTRKHSEHANDYPCYQKDYEKAVKTIAHDEENGQSPQRLAEIIVRMLKRKHLPRRKKIMKPDEALGWLLHRILPGGLYAKILQKCYMSK